MGEHHRSLRHAMTAKELLERRFDVSKPPAPARMRQSA